MDESIERRDGLSRQSIAAAVAAAGMVVALLWGLSALRRDGAVEPTERLITLTTESCGATAGGIGTGVLVGGDLAVTVAHVALTGGPVMVDTPDGRTVLAEVVALDRTADLAVLQLAGVDASDVEFAEFEPGEAIRVVGGQSGLVSGRAVRPVDITIEEVGGTDRVERDGYEIEADLVKGDSGAGVFDEDGRLGGIVFAVSRRTDGVTWVSDASEVAGLLGTDLQPLRCDVDLGRAAPVG